MTIISYGSATMQAERYDDECSKGGQIVSSFSTIRDSVAGLLVDTKLNTG